MVGQSGPLPTLQQALANPPAPPKSHGGLFGRVGHFVASKAALAGRDIKAVPAGLVQLAKADYGSVKQTIEHPLISPSKFGAMYEHPERVVPGTAETPGVVAIGKGTIHSSEHALQHPLADPFQTAITVAPFARGLGAGLIRTGAAVDAARAGEGVAGALKAAAARPDLGPRLIQTGETRVPLYASRNPAVRIVQAGYDKAIQHALNTNPEGRLAAHAAKRIGGSIAESERARTRMTAAPANAIERGGRQLGRGINRKVNEAALRLTSENTSPEDAAAYHRAQAEKGVSPTQNLKMAKLYDQVTAHGLLTKDEHGNVIVDAARHPQLAALDAQIAHAQDQVDRIATEHGMMTPDQLEARRNGPARIRAGGAYQETYLPASYADLSTGQTVRVAGKTTEGKVAEIHGHTPDAEATVYYPRFGSSARVPIRNLEVKGHPEIIGGETANPGRGFVTYKTSMPRASKGAAASSSGPVVGKARGFIPKQSITYSGLEHGLVPDTTSALVARHFRDAMRFVSTDRFRKLAVTTGSDVRRSSRDVLVRIPDAAEADKVPPAVEELLGKRRSTLGELDNVRNGFDAWRQRLVPGVADDFAENRQTPIGVEAPEGYRWVDQNVLGELGRPGPGPRGWFARTADKLNSAVTAATVYFKIGHIGTRTLTNATTNIIQGSARPTEIAKSVELWRALSPGERAKALGAAGQHSYEALPVTNEEGPISHAVSVTARAGANFWARHFDVPFRFNSIAYEARKGGFVTPAQFREFLGALENPHGLSPEDAARVEDVAKRANREAIAYDRLSEAERRYLARAFWFYPWVSGSTRFLVNTALEHPFKLAALGSLGVQGRNTQQAALGDLPSYEQGLIPFGHGSHPTVADFSTFSPFSTPADLAQLASVGQASNYLNPAYAALLQLVTRQNAFGQHTNTPVSDAASSLFQPTPEAQIISALRHKPKPTQMFKKTPANELARALLGPGLPRRLNVAAANKAAARERAGR